MNNTTFDKMGKGYEDNSQVAKYNCQRERASTPTCKRDEKDTIIPN